MARPIITILSSSAAARAADRWRADCRAHEVDNLYVTDASFFPSIGAVNPTLTIIANAFALPTTSRSA